MQEETENKLELKDRLKNFYNHNKVKIYVILFILFTLTISVFLFQYKNEKKNISIAEKYIQAGIYLSTKENENAKKLYEEIILSKNKFYSILALNTILEKKLISDEKMILNYFSILLNSIKSEEQKDLINLKKALYLIKNSDAKTGKSILEKLVNKDSTFKSIALDALKNK